MIEYRWSELLKIMNSQGVKGFWLKYEWCLMLQLSHSEERGDIVLFWCGKTMWVMRLNCKSKVSLRFEGFMGDFNPIEVLKICSFFVWNLGNLQSSRFIWWWHACKCEWMSLATNESSEFHKHEATKKKRYVLIVACCASWDFYLCKSMAYAYQC